jgi:hypothetical protein
VKRSDDDDDLPRPPLRRRLLVLLLAVVTAVTIVLLLIYRPGDPKRSLRTVKPVAEAASSVGGKADVMLLPPAASSPR